MALFGLLAGCARPRAPDVAGVTADVRKRTAVPAEAPSSLDTWLANGLSEDEAVALALVRSPEFQADLAEMGIAAAALHEAAQLRNPVLTLLLPWGPKQLEATARWPVDTLLLRPRRVAAARLDAEAAAQRLVASGLGLVARVRSAWADALLARERAALVEETAAVRERIAQIAEERLRLGEVSAFEIGIARADRARAREDRVRQKAEEEIAFERLAALTGLPKVDFALETSDAEAVPCTDVESLLADARAARPELRAAELTVEAAARRAGLPRLEALGLVAVLDANRTPDGFDVGPGFDVQVPLFNLGGAAADRARAELRRAEARYVALQSQVALEVREARLRWTAARAALDAWEAIVAEREQELTLSRARHEAGEDSLLVALESERQLGEARARRAEVKGELRRARATLGRAIGRQPSCGGTTR